MRIAEAAAGGAVSAVVVVLIASRVSVGVDLVIAGAIAFLVSFLMVMLRADRQYVERHPK